MSLELGRAFWQFQLSGVPLLPRLVTWGKVGEVEGEFWLKVWGERLLFCAAAEPSKVYVVTTPCLQSQNLVAFWRKEIYEGGFGRLVMHSQPLAGAEETDTAFLFICMQDGRRWMREWCGEEWREMKKVRPSLTPVWHPSWRLPTEHSLNVADDILRELASRPFPEAEHRNQDFVWLRGSRIELKHVLQACVHLMFTPNSTDPFGRPLREGTEHIYYFAHTPFFQSSMNWGSQMWFSPDAWQTLLKAYFVGVGWNWTTRKKKNEELREGWKVAPSTQSVKVPLSLSSSHHEQLEARLFLRGWLQGKVPDKDIEGLLSLQVKARFFL